MAKTSSSKSSSKSSAPKTSSTKGQTGFDKKGNRVSVNSSSAVSFGNVKGGSTSTTRPTAPAPSSFSTAPAPAPTPAIGQPEAQPSSYQIQGGDTLGGIASRYGTSVQSLMAQNPSISNPNMIRAGASLNIGPMGVPPKAQQTVSGDQMAGVKPYNVPGTPTPTLSSGLIADVASSTADAAATSTPEPVNPQQQTLDYIQQLTQQQGEKGDRTLEIQKKEKLDTKQRDLTAIDNKIKERTRALELKRRAIIESPYAGTKSGQQRDLDTLERQSAQELADLAIVKSVALEDYTTAYDIAQRKIDAEFEPLQQQIDNAIKFYQLNQDNLTASEKMKLSAQIEEQQATVDFERQKQLYDYKTKIDNAASGGGYSSGGSGGSGNGQPSDTVTYYAQLLREGKIGLSNVPQNIRNAVVLASKGEINQALGETAIKELAQTDSAIANLRSLRETVSNNLQYVGPIAGFAALNPWSAARKAQADIDRVRQSVGKALEGGVLRKEDEEKYKKILATLNDTPETALYKIDALISTLERDKEIYKSQQASAGRAVNVAGAPDAASLRSTYGY